MTPSKHTLQFSIKSLLILVGCICIWLGGELMLAAPGCAASAGVE
jgi:hypothetical protein